MNKNARREILRARSSVARALATLDRILEESEEAPALVAAEGMAAYDRPTRSTVVVVNRRGDSILVELSSEAGSTRFFRKPSDLLEVAHPFRTII